MDPAPRAGRTYSGLCASRQAEVRGVFGRRKVMPHPVVLRPRTLFPLNLALTMMLLRLGLARAFQGAGRRAGVGVAVLAFLAGGHALIHRFRIIRWKMLRHAIIDRAGGVVVRTATSEHQHHSNQHGASQHGAFLASACAGADLEVCTSIILYQVD